MALRTLAALLVVATSFTLAACSGGGSASPVQVHADPTATPATGTLSASPQAIQFSAIPPVPSPQPVTLSGSALAAGLPLTSSIADPTVVGVTQLAFVQAAPPAYAVFPIAHGSTTITFTTGGATATVTATGALCGRPDSILIAQLIYPPPGSTNVPPNATTLYFVIYARDTVVPPLPPIHAHLIVGAHDTLDSVTPMQPAQRPPGAATPTPPPIPNAIGYVMSVPAPPMPAGASIRTQVYDDACQLPLLAGGFST